VISIDVVRSPLRLIPSSAISLSALPWRASSFLVCVEVPRDGPWGKVWGHEPAEVEAARAHVAVSGESVEETEMTVLSAGWSEARGPGDVSW
jgi:hypothetical protein